MVKRMQILKLMIAMLMAICASQVWAADKNPKNLHIEPQTLVHVEAGWHIIAEAKGDLNKDGVQDYILVVEADDESLHTVTKTRFTTEPPYWSQGDKEQWESQAAQRKFMVFFGQKSSRINLVFSNGDWIDRVDFGGWYGDPFNRLWIDNGSILISTYGQAPYGYTTTIRIRFQEDKWRIIGYTDMDIVKIPMKITHFDRNLLTHKVKIKLYEDGEFIKEYWDEIANHNPIYLANEADLNRAAFIENQPAPIELSADILLQIAKGWHVIDQAKGDLNQDGRTDMVIIAQKDIAELHYVHQVELLNQAPYLRANNIENWDSMAADRKFMVFFAQNNGSYKHVFSNGDWVGRADFGGMLGDSHDGIKVDNGSIVVSTYGGARTRWSNDTRIRFEGGKWRIIGYSNLSLDPFTIDWSEHDRNLLSYKIKITEYKNDILVSEIWDDIEDKTKLYLENSPLD